MYRRDNNFINDMEVKELVNDGLTIRLSFHFVKEDYADSRKKALNRFRRSADIRGFRKGMAPMSLIERVYGGQALVESVNELISNSLNNSSTTRRKRNTRSSFTSSIPAWRTATRSRTVIS